MPQTRHHRSRLRLVIAACLPLCAVPAAAQIPSSWWPPRVLLIETVKVAPGRMPQFEQEVKRSLQEKASRTTPSRLGLIATVGDLHEAVFLIGYDSVPQLEDDLLSVLQTTTGNLRLENEPLVESRNRIIAVLRQDLSYRATPLDLVEYPFFYLNQHTVRAGHNEQYEQDVRALLATTELQQSVRHWYLYRAVAGAPAGTAFHFEPMRSIVDLTPKNGDASNSMTAVQQQQLGALWKDYLIESESSPRPSILVLRPAMSFSKK